MKFKNTIFGFIFVLGFLSCSHAPKNSVFNKDKPNVLFIAVDDMNDWVGCLNGHPQAHSPNIDRLAKRGVLFTNAHCAAPACNPSRASIFSGKFPEKTGVWSNESGSLRKESPETKLLTSLFRDAGYKVFGTGKLLGRGDTEIYDEYFGPNQRWSPIPKKDAEYSDADLSTKGTINPRHEVTDSQGNVHVLPLNRMPSDRAPHKKSGESFDWGPWDVPDNDFGDTQITDWAINKLQTGSANPLFLGIGYYRPHIPLWAPRKYFDRFTSTPGILPEILENDLDDLSETAVKWAREPITAGSHATTLKFNQWQPAVEAYLACISYVDYEIGRLLDELDKSGLAENTLIVLWSDHGWHLGEKEHWGKWTGWERSTKVPFIIVPPKNWKEWDKKGSRCGQAVSLIDIFPTLSEFCNLNAVEELDGKSLIPLVKNPTEKTNRVVTTFFDPGNISLRDSTWRYIRYKDGSEELYNVTNDKNEWYNLAGRNEYKTVIREISSNAAKISSGEND